MAVSKSTTFSESNISIENNTSSLTINIYFSAGNYETYFTNEPLYCTCNGVTQSQIVSHSRGGYVNVSFTFNNIPHNNDGSKVVSWSWNCNTGTQILGNIGDSGSQPLTKINRTITNSVSGTDIDDYFSVNYTKMIDVNYTYKLRISLPYIVLLERINYNTSDEPFMLSQQVIEDLYSRYTTVNSFDLGFAVETWSSDGQTRISEGNEVIIKARITGANPVFNDFSFQDINSTTVALTGNNKINVNGYSNIQITISVLNKAVAQKGASMVKYRIIVGEQTYDVNYSNSEITTTVNKCTSGTYQIYAIDTRGNSTLVTKLADSVKNYSDLVRDTSFSATRDDGGIGGNVTLSFSGTIWNNSFGSVSNAFDTAKYLFKKTDSSTWIDLGSSMTDITPTINGNTFSFSGLIRSDNPDTTWDLDSSYDIKVVLEDKLSSVEIIMVLASAIPNISLSRNGVGIMCDYDESLGGALQIAGEVYNNILVKEVELIASSSSINIDGLDLASDGAIYEIYFQAKNCSNASGIFMKINGNDSGSSIYQEYTSGAVNVSSRVNRIGRTNAGSSFILINISLTNEIMLSTRGTDGAYGFAGNLWHNQSNVTSLQFYPEFGTFGIGTKIRIYKK